MALYRFAEREGLAMPISNGGTLQSDIGPAGRLYFFIHVVSNQFDDLAIKIKAIL
jgi:hypothetical protein